MYLFQSTNNTAMLDENAPDKNHLGKHWDNSSTTVVVGVVKQRQIFSSPAIAVNGVVVAVGINCCDEPDTSFTAAEKAGTHQLTFAVSPACSIFIRVVAIAQNRISYSCDVVWVNPRVVERVQELGQGLYRLLVAPRCVVRPPDDGHHRLGFATWVHGEGSARASKTSIQHGEKERKREASHDQEEAFRDLFADKLPTFDVVCRAPIDRWSFTEQ